MGGAAFISGKLSKVVGLSGQISVVPPTIPYSGDYKVVPKAFEAQTLPTANRLLKEDIVITEIPYFETSNQSDGITVYIAKEVNYGRE